MPILSGCQNLTISRSTINVVSGNQKNKRARFSLQSDDDADSAHHQSATTVQPGACISGVPRVPGKTALPRLSDMFTGREDILQQMAQYLDPTKPSVILKKQRIFVLYGLGGAGKTQIMAKFVVEFGDQFFDVYYIDASTPETIKASFEDIARTTSLGNTVDDALNWLAQECKDWLLIIDNADNPKIDLRPFLPRCRHGNVIITTRNPDCRRYAPDSYCIVSGMKHDDAVELLLKSSLVERSARNRSLARSICKELGYLALAIAQAGAYIQQCCAISEYLQIYREDRSKLLQRHSVQTVDDYQWTVYTTWEMSLKRLTPTAAKFLRLCAFMHHDGISKAIFQSAATAGDMQDAFRDGRHFLNDFKSENGKWSNIRFHEYIEELVSYSLISIDTENQVYSIHPLVHTWARNRASHAKQSEAQNCVLQILALAVNDDYSAEAYAFRRSLLSHIDESRTDTMNHDIADKLQKVYFEAQQLRTAEKMQKLAIEARLVLGDDHPKMLTSVSNLACTYMCQGRWKESEELELKNMAARRRLLGDDHPDTLRTMANLACTYRKQGRWKEAEELGLQVTNAMRRLLGDEHPETLKTMANLSCTYGKQGRLKEAGELNMQVMKARKMLLGNDHPKTLSSMADLASIYKKQGRWKEAEELNLKVMKVRRRLLGDNHPNTLSSIVNLASTYSMQGRWKEAEELGLQVTKALRRLLGDDHPSTLISIAHLAGTYWKQGRWKEAEELDLRVMKARRRLLSDDHPDTLSSKADLASTYSMQGRWKDAEELGLQVTKAMRRLLGNNHPATLISTANLASTYWKQGRLKDAEELDIQVMKATTKLQGDDHPDTLSSIVNLASTYSKQGRWKKAEELGLQGMKAMRRLLGNDHPATLISMANLASTYWKQGRWKEAEELYLQVVKGKRNLLGNDHLDTLTSLEVLASIYKKQGRWTEAEALNLKVMNARRRLQGDDHPDTLSSIVDLASTCSKQGRWKDAEEVELQVAKAMSRLLGNDHAAMLFGMAHLASIYWEQGRWKEDGGHNLQMRVSKRLLDNDHLDALAIIADLAPKNGKHGRCLDQQMPCPPKRSSSMYSSPTLASS